MRTIPAGSSILGMLEGCSKATLVLESQRGLYENRHSVMLGLPRPRSRPVWFWPSCTHTKLHTQQLRAGQSSWGWLLGATHLRCHCLEGRNCAWGGGIACAPIEGLQLFSSWEHSLWWLSWLQPHQKYCGCLVSFLRRFSVFRLLCMHCLP